MGGEFRRERPAGSMTPEGAQVRVHSGTGVEAVRPAGPTASGKQKFLIEGYTEAIIRSNVKAVEPCKQKRAIQL